MKRRDLIACAPLAVAALAGATPLLARAQAIDPAGRFTPIQPPQPTEVPEGQVEVVEVFWYGCPHCFTFLPVMESWLEHKPDHISVRRMPAIFRDSWENHARAFYTAKRLGVVEAIHVPLFNAIHLDGKRMDTEDSLADLFEERADVSRDDFDKAWSSFSVESLMQKSRVMQRKYGVRGTPSVVVAGKYLVSGSVAGSYENMLKVIAALADMEHNSTS